MLFRSLCFVFHAALTLFLYGNYGYSRIWFPVNFFCAIFLGLTLFYFGVKFQTLVYRMHLLSFSLGCMLTGYFIIHVPKIWNFKEEYLGRIAFLKSHNNQFKGKIIVMKPLSDSDILSTNDISGEPNYIVNTSFSAFYDLDFKVSKTK